MDGLEVDVEPNPSSPYKPSTFQTSCLPLLSSRITSGSLACDLFVGVTSCRTQLWVDGLEVDVEPNPSSPYKPSTFQTSCLPLLSSRITSGSLACDLFVGVTSCKKTTLGE